jgi:hypothetical protein
MGVMGKLSKFRALPRPQRRLLVRTARLTATVSLALRLLPFTALQRWLQPKSASAAPAAPSKDDIVWAVTIAGRYVPGATCLVQALVAERMLKRAGHPAQLRIGVSNQPTFRAHAWVESDGKVLLGETEVLAEFTSLPALKKS